MCWSFSLLPGQHGGRLRAAEAVTDAVQCRLGWGRVRKKRSFAMKSLVYFLVIFVSFQTIRGCTLYFYEILSPWQKKEHADVVGTNRIEKSSNVTGD